MPQTEAQDYRAHQPQLAQNGRHEERSMLDEARDQAKQLGERAGDIAGEIARAARERPYTTLAIAAGLAFAAGALWKVGHMRQRSQLDTLLARLPDMPSRDSILSRWR